MKKKINELIDDPRKKAILFFGFYLVLFVVIILSLRSAHRNSNNTTYEKGNSLSYNASLLKGNNYSYNYKIVLDDVVYEYNGKRKENTELFTLNGKEYYRNNDSYFVNNNSIWVKTNNPYNYSEFLNVDNLITIIDSSFYEAKITYYTGSISYKLLASTNTINQKINNINSDFFEEPNSIILDTIDGEYMDGISLNLDSYCKLNKTCQRSLKITIKYSDIGKIDNIENPINM